MKLQRLPTGQYVVNLPKAIVESLGWKKFDKLKVLIKDLSTLEIRKEKNDEN